MPELPRIVAVVGTNASGKSSLGVRLAQRFGGEIVSADSRQVFRGLDLGSGKISPEEMRGVPHHLLGVCEPNDFFSMADFQALAYRAIDGILARGRVVRTKTDQARYSEAKRKTLSKALGAAKG